MSADVPRARCIEEHGAFRRIEILRLRAVTLAVEKLHRHEGVKKVGIRAWMEAQLLAQFSPGEPTTGERREQTRPRRP